MRAVKRCAFLFVAVLIVTLFASLAQAAFPEYVNQNSDTTHKHSAICTKDGIPIWDTMFSPMVLNPFAFWHPLNYEEIAFGFMQCYGGGMIDELQVAGFDPASYTSASRHNEQAWHGTRDSASGGKRESYYNLHYSPWVGGATAHTHYEAANNAYNNDLVGPVVRNPLREHPQFSYIPYIIRDDVTLHRPNLDPETGEPGETPDTYVAIIFGGSTNCWANYNSVARIYSDLKARGYTDNEIYLMYPSGRKPNGQLLPASWEVDDGTNFQDMVDAWQWANLNSNATTQVYFWSSICHGTDTYDLIGHIVDDLELEILPEVEYVFDLETDFVAQVTELFSFFEGKPEGQPYFQVITPEVVGDLSVILNGEPLALLGVNDYTVFEVNDTTAWEESRFLYKFSLDSTDIANLLVMGNSFEFNWSGGPIDFKMAGLTTGDMANAIPEPTSLALLALGSLALVRRRRR